MRLGKLAPRLDPRTLRLARYVTQDFSPAPSSVDWYSAAKAQPMFLNDRYGCCTCSTAGLMIDGWTAENGAELVLPDAAIDRAYRDVSGFDGSPETDNGAVVLDLLNYWRRTGIGGHKIRAFVALDLKNREHFKISIARFGGVYLGFSLPQSAPFDGDWIARLGGTQGDPTPGSLGGHAVPGVGYIDEGGLDDGLIIRTWGKRKRVTWSFLDLYCDEAYAVLSPDWDDADGAPSGFDSAALTADLAAVAA